jgi:ATP-dependent Clp protease ATP-binding subunit ClpB
VDFRNTVIIMTSNIGSEYIRNLGGEVDSLRKQVMEALRSNFRPEFLNRVDEVIFFNNLGKTEIERIVEIQLAHLERRLGQRGLKLEVSEPAKKLLADLGYDPAYGARPLKRTIQREVMDALALKILEGEFQEGDTIRVDSQDRTFLFVKQ